MQLDPNSIRINNLQPWEKTLLIFRRHWIALVYVIWWIFFLVFSVIAMIIFSKVIWDIVNVILVCYVSTFLLFIYINWMRYELDLYIITNKRIIWLEEVSFLNRHLSECPLDKVQEVNAKTVWLLSNLLNYWVVTIHTASEASDFKMELMPDAYDSARLISNIISEHKEKRD